ncbi:MAG TPA: mechanosensitive ion channel domain-containing protein [Steroidobacter sp.]|uniref:mechanosensitive ion channel family protein n=1 Tax=Steroidobacter sp. TaxID=1978227 RepID=UPI002ED82E01
MHPFWTVLLLIAVAPSAAAQIRASETSRDTVSPTPELVEDAFGRTSPRTAIVAFIRAASREDYAFAARYMQVSEEQRRNAAELARDLRELMDDHFTQALTNISDSPSGALDDGLPIDRERIGPLAVGGRKVDIELRRVSDPQAGSIWLISSETLAMIPSLRNSSDRSWIERTMPASLIHHELFGVSLAHWSVFAASLLVPFALLALLAAFCVLIARRIVGDDARMRELDIWYADLRWPVIASLTVVIHMASLPMVGLPLAFRLGYARLAFLLLAITLTWLLPRLLTLGFARARALAAGRNRASTRSLMLLGERMMKALVIVAATVAILLIVGVEPKTALAAFGIVGIALALGAQRTVENLLGGVFMLSDRAIAVGDLCSISNRLGWIEDITLRSVRIRTLDNSLVSVPAGVLAQEGIENFATREKILAQSILRLQHGTRPEQLRRILAGASKLLAESSNIERGTSRIRLVDFAPEAIELELFAYVLTDDVPRFLEIREGLLLEIAALIHAEGSGFAQPTQFIYMDETPGADVRADTLISHEAGARLETRASPSTKGTRIDSDALAASR